MAKYAALSHVGGAILGGGVVLIVMGYLFSLIPVDQVAPDNPIFWYYFLNGFIIIGIILVCVGVPFLVIGLVLWRRHSEL